MNNINNDLNLLLKKVESVSIEKLQSQLEKMISEYDQNNNESDAQLKKIQEDFTNLSASLHKLADFIDKRFSSHIHD